MKITVEAGSKEIAALVAALQGRQNSGTSPANAIQEVVRQAIRDTPQASPQS